MRRMLLSGPAVEPVLVAEAKAHLRLDTADEDEVVGALLVAARIAAEAEIRQVMIAQSWRVAFPAWPADRVAALPIVPLQSVQAVRAIDGAGGSRLLAAAEYEVDREAATVTLAPTADTASAAEFEIDFTAGYGTSGVDVPQPLRLAIRMLVTHWFENRSPVALGDVAAPMPGGWRELLAPYRRLRLC